MLRENVVITPWVLTMRPLVLETSNSSESKVLNVNG